MKRFLWAITAILLLPFLASAQNIFKAKLINAESKQPIANATVNVKSLTQNYKTNESGVVEILDIANGEQQFAFKHVGFEEISKLIKFPLDNDSLMVIELKPTDEELETVVISTTRSSRSIADIPTRVEFIASEELEEKANMKPGDIRMILNESTGIQTQQTSALSANASIRIQGLDGRYTQILRDGLPVYSGAASGLGLLQVAPLDLKQIEVVKGSASTLYGGGAIAGLVNLISKTPEMERELNFHLDATDALGYTLNGFYSKRNQKVGTTLFASYQNNSAYDPAGIDLTAIPKSEKFTFNPKLFIYPTEKTTITLGLNGVRENRIGGDIHFIDGTNEAGHTFYERNQTNRISSQFALDHDFGKCSHITLKNSIGYFNRKLGMPNYLFDGNQYTTFTEANYASHGEIAEWIVGVNLMTDKFSEASVVNSVNRSYQQTTTGIFLQNNTKLYDWWHLESGVRLDHVKDYGTVFLPRLSSLFKIDEHWSSRLGGGFGYKAPTLFTEDSERIQYQNVLPLNASNGLEKSYGANWDVNYRTSLFDNSVSISVNQLFFYTHLNNPLLLMPIGPAYQFQNISGSLSSKGIETNVKLGYEDFKLFLGYTFTDAELNNNGAVTPNTLTAKHRVNSVLMYEVEEKWKLGLEAYTFSKQLLNDNTYGKRYTIMGFMAEKLFEKFSIYINFENFLDTRQTRFENIYTGSLTNPQFRDVYAPLDGFVINGGIKLKL